MMDAKSKLQQKVLALKKGYIASDIKYASIRAKNDKWRATVHIHYLKFPITKPFHNKRSAETAAAQNILDSWRGVARALKRSQKRNSKYSFCNEKRGYSGMILCYGSECEEEEEAEERWNLDAACSDIRRGALSQEDYAEIGKHVHAICLIMQKKT